MTASSQQRINIYETDPESYKPLYALEKYVHAGTLGEDLIALIKIRVSQINHCAYCLDMHVKEARKENVPARKIDILAAWHEAKNFYTEREQAALLLAEEVTLISENGVQDETWNSVKTEFAEQEIVTLLMAIAAINTWNRLAIASRQVLPEA